MRLLIIVLDFLFFSVTFVTGLLGVWHFFNKKVGADEDIYIFVLFLIMFMIYNYIVNYSCTILWNRGKEYFLLFCINIVFMIILSKFFLDDKKGEKGET
jgi:hypothetical protein